MMKDEREEWDKRWREIGGHGFFKIICCVLCLLTNLESKESPTL